jgi:hypothetical protein
VSGAPPPEAEPSTVLRLDLSLPKVESLRSRPRKSEAAPATVTAQPDGELQNMFQAVEGRPSTSSGRPELQNMFKAVEGRWGSREIEISDVTLLDGGQQPSFLFHSGDPMSVRLRIVAHAPATDFVFGLSLFNADGVCCYGTNTFIEEMDPERLEGEVDVTLAIESLDLVEGTYKLDVAVHTCDGYPYDYHRLLYTFRVKSRTPDVGIYRPRHRWSFSPGVRFKQKS